MTSLILAIFAASVLGSLHCAGMCGAFVAIAVQDRGNWRRHASLQAAYHGGRLASYLSLGIAAGSRDDCSISAARWREFAPPPRSWPESQ